MQKMIAYHCPRCRNPNIIEFIESIICPQCELEFEKDDLESIGEGRVLSVQEKLEFIKFFELK